MIKKKGSSLFRKRKTNLRQCLCVTRGAGLGKDLKKNTEERVLGANDCDCRSVCAPLCDVWTQHAREMDRSWDF